MSAAETLFDQMCCNTAVAVEALADAGDLGFVAVVGGQSVDAPSLSAVSDPALFTIGRGNPNSGLAIAVVNEQRPFSLEFGDVVVTNHGGSQRVHHNQVVLSKNELGTNPKQRCCGANCNCCSGINADIALGSRVEKSLRQEQGVKKQGNTAPNQIALGAKNRRVLHLTIIAGTPADGKGK